MKILNKLFKYILRKKYFVKDNEGKNLFSIREMGGDTIERGTTFYSKEPETVDWIKNFNKNSLFFDIGANIGIYSLFAAERGHSVISFEPESHNYFTLNMNIFDNNFNNKIIAYPISLDEKMLISKLNINKNRFGASGHSFSRSIDSKGKIFHPSCIQGSISKSFDEFVDETKIVPDYVKIDVDGNELKVINGMKKTLSLKKIKSILIELNNSFDEHTKIKIFLKSEGYVCVYGENINKNSSNYIFNL